MDNYDDATAGEEAMEIIAGHPLYASTSGITYATAIKLAAVLVESGDM